MNLTSWTLSRAGSPQMSGFRLSTALVVTFFIIGGSPSSGGIPQEAGFAAEERGPNWIQPQSEFGAYGMAAGQLLGPQSVALGTEGRVYVSNSGNHRIEVFSLEGAPLQGWGKPGSKPGEFRFPAGVSVGPNGDVYVADPGNGRIQVFDSHGAFRREWGASGVSPATLISPFKVAIRDERVYVLEKGNPQIQIFTVEGKLLGKFGEFGDGPGQFRNPTDLALDDRGQLYVADADLHRIQKLNANGDPLLQWGAWGSPEGLLSAPTGLAWAAGRVYVADSANHRIQVFDASGTFLYQWGAPPATEHGGQGHLHFPSSIAVGRAGERAVVCEQLENRCQIFSLGNARKVTPAKDLPWWDNLHTRFHTAMFPRLPEGVSPGLSRWGRSPPVLAPILEQEAHSVIFFDISLRPCFLVTRTGGNGRRLGEFRWPSGVAMDASRGRIYVTDRGNRRIQILELSQDQTSRSGFARNVRFIASFEPSLLAPKSLEGYMPERASLDAVCLDSEGNLLVADGNNAVVLKIDPQGRLTEVIRVRRDPSGRLQKWVGIALTPDGNGMYLVDQYGFQVRCFTGKGDFQGSWGRRGAEDDDGFLCPSGITVDADGCVYVADSGLHKIKKFDSKGKLMTQWGRYGFRDGELWSPEGIIFIAPDRIIVDDFGNHRGQVFTRNGEFVASVYKGGRPSLFPSR
jgi:tripartite motif-containing protein 71